VLCRIFLVSELAIVEWQLWVVNEETEYNTRMGLIFARQYSQISI
jgi:hypothetical protein